MCWASGNAHGGVIRGREMLMVKGGVIIYH